MEQAVWITQDKAVEAVRRSRWATSRKRRNEKPRGIYKFALAQINPERDETNMMFYKWCELALVSFSKSNSTSVRQIDNGQEYDEVALLKWLDKRYETDVIAEFGEPY